MTDVPVEDRTVLFSDNRPGYLCRHLSDYLVLMGIRRIMATAYHPQTNASQKDITVLLKERLISRPTKYLVKL